MKSHPQKSGTPHVLFAGELQEEGSKSGRNRKRLAFGAISVYDSFDE